MEKAAIMEYLDVVCDAENAIFACDEVIKSLTEQKRNYPRLTPPLPPNPVLIKYEDPNIKKRKRFDRTHEKIFSISASVLCILFISIILHILEDVHLINPTISIILLIVGVLASFILGPALGEKLMDKLLVVPREEKAMEKINEQRRTAEEAENQRLAAIYAKKCKQYNQEIIVERGILSEFDDAISEKQQIKKNIVNELQQLYERQIIYPAFRNMIAANQIREYMRMGICNALEGPDGAYAQYLQDVRTNKICDSLTDLKENLVLALNRIAATQATLIHELRETNNNVKSMETSINNSIAGMQSSLVSAQNATMEQFEEYMLKANNSLTEIKHSLSTASYNQYIALRQSNVRNYLLKAPD